MAVALAFGAVVVRLVDLQVVSADSYEASGVAQRLVTVDLPAERGSIFDRSGNELAMSVPQHTVWADPRLIDDPAGAARRLAPVLGADEAALASSLAGDGAFVYLARQIDDATAQRVTELDVDGVSLLDESKRFMPNGPLATSILGDVDVDNNGVAGLELQFEDALVGDPGELLVERGPDGRTIAAGEQQLRPAARGEDLVLTIDRSLQFEAERALAEQVAATKANGGICIVMDPRTGEILAMANVRKGKEEGDPPTVARDNMAVTTLFEPGSVNKVVTMSGALEDGVVTPDTVMNVPDSIVVGTRRFSDHDPHADVDWSVTDILGTSSNVGTIMVGQKVGDARMEDWLRRFGMGAQTGLGFPNESAGILADRADWSGATLPSVSIGYGVSVNALQMLGAFNAVANGGVRVEPTLVRATVDAEGNEHPAAPGKPVPVISPETADKMTAMLTNVVAAGTGTNAAIAGYTVAGKTGTARKVVAGHYSGGYTASFAGFMPAEDPQLSTIVVLDEPHPYYGGLAAAPVFARVSQYALRHFRIPPPAVAGVEVPTTLAPAVAAPRD